MSNESEVRDFDADPAGLPPVEQLSEKARSLVIAGGFLTKGNLESEIQKVEAMGLYWKRVKALVISETRGRDWAIFGDGEKAKCYPTEGAVKTMLTRLGASIRDLRTWEEKKTDDTGRTDIFFTSTGIIHFHGREFPEIGVSSTRDDFFAKRTKYIPDPDNPGKQKAETYLLKPDEMNIGHVRKKSVTNLYYRLLNDVFPCHFTPDELKAFGVDLTGTASVGFKDGAKGGGSAGETPEDKAIRVNLHNALLRIAKAEEKEVADVLRDLTAFNEFQGYTDVNKVSVKMLKRTYESALKRLEKAGPVADAAPAGGKAGPK